MKTGRLRSGSSTISKTPNGESQSEQETCGRSPATNEVTKNAYATSLFGISLRAARALGLCCGAGQSTRDNPFTGRCDDEAVQFSIFRGRADPSAIHLHRRRLFAAAGVERYSCRREVAGVDRRRPGRAGRNVGALGGIQPAGDRRRLAGRDQGRETAPGGGTQGTNSWRRIGYGGPCPPSGTHRYFFKLYALDTTLSLGNNTAAKDLQAAMKGHILAETQLMGRFKR